MASDPFISIRMERDALALVRRAEKQFGKEELYRALVSRFFDPRAKRIAGNVSRGIRSGEFGIQNRTGSLGRSIVGRGVLFQDRPGLQIGILKGPATRYASVQEHGTKGINPQSPHATIVPKKAKALAVPVSGGPALTPAGVPRYVTPRDYPKPLQFVPFKKGNVVGGLYEQATVKDGDIAGATLVYLLLRKVDIKPHRFFRDGVGRQIPDLVRDLGLWLRDYIAGAGGARG